MTVLVALIAAAIALVLGIVVGLRISRTRFSRGRSISPSITVLLKQLITSSQHGIIVMNPLGDLVLHNPQAEALGLVKQGNVDPRALKAAKALASAPSASAEMKSREVDLSHPGGRKRRPKAVLGQVRHLIDGFIVVEATDHSETVRLEATRRDFVANVSHELKTPVGAIALLAEAILDAAEDAREVRRFGEKILRESHRLGTLVTELIALSRLQGAERLPDLSVVEVDSVVCETLARTKISAEAAEITIDVDAPEGYQVEGDWTLLVTALSNLVENAIAYSPAGSSVSISRRLEAGFVEVAVTDRGIGIPDEEQQRVFERFYRTDKARSRATGGTGLGLAIVKHVAANHGGEVRLWSSPGVGSTFTLRIPKYHSV